MSLLSNISLSKISLSILGLVYSFSAFAEDGARLIKDMPFQREPVVQSGDLYRVIVVLIFMLILAAAILFFLKKKLGIKKGFSFTSQENVSEDKIKIIDNKRITANSTVTLLEVGNDRVLVAINKENIAMTSLGTVGKCASLEHVPSDSANSENPGVTNLDITQTKNQTQVQNEAQV